MLAIPLRDADPVILDVEDQGVFILARPDRQLSAVGHGLYAIHREVEDDLLDLRTAAGVAEALLQFIVPSQSDRLFANLCGHQLPEVG